MRKAIYILLLVFASFFWVKPVEAHPADQYSHAFHIQLSTGGMTIRWDVKSGPLLATWMWDQADANQDGLVSQSEAIAWGATPAAMLAVSVDGVTLPLNLEKVDFPTQQSEFQAGAQFPVLTLSAKWPDGMNDQAKLAVTNNLDVQNSFNWFGISAQDPTAFQVPAQDGNHLVIELVRDRTRLPETNSLLSSWDSNTPVIQNNSNTTLAPVAVQPASPQEILVGLVKEEQFSASFFLLALGSSLVLGALHALTPGHGKTVVAAYLVGARGTTRHAIILGSIVTLTHTGSVLLLGLVTLLASRYFLPTNLIPATEVVSGLLIVGLGVYLLVQRLGEWRHSRLHLHREHHHSPEEDFSGHTHPDHNKEDEHVHPHLQVHEHSHSHEIPETLTWRSLIALGISGGLVPCPDAIAILLVAIAINRIAFGLTLIVSFSLGLAVVLIAIGLLMVHGRRLFERMEVFNRFAPAMPVLSAVVVILLGGLLTLSSAAQFQSGFNLAGPTNSLQNAQIIYLGDGSNGHKQLYVVDSSGKNQRELTAAPLGVTDYAVSPDQSQVFYLTQNPGFGSDIWLANLDGTQNRQVTGCANALCRQPEWSPDGRRVIYESIDLRENASLLSVPTLWWLDFISGQAQPVFQKSNLPVTNPRWSPDGAWLSYATPEGIHLYNLSSGENRLIPNRTGSVVSWAPDSHSILLRDSIASGNDLVNQLFRYDLVSQQISAFDPDLSVEHLLVTYSPGGDLVALIQRRVDHPTENQVWLVRADGSQPREVASVENGIYSCLSWSPDGNTLLTDLYLINSQSLESGLQLIDINTGKVQELGPGSSPAWIWSRAPANGSKTQ